MRVHDAWLEARLKETSLAAKVFNTLVTGTPGLPYLVFYPRDGVDRVTSAAGPASQQNPSWILHGVGADATQAKWAIEQAKKKFIVNGTGITATITSETPGRMWFTSTEPVQVDRDVSPPLCFQVAECGFSSDLIKSL